MIQSNWRQWLAILSILAFIANGVVNQSRMVATDASVQYGGVVR